MKTIGILTMAVALTACNGMQHKPSQSMNGNHLYTMDCSGFNHSLEVCMDNAQTLCAEGFSIVKNKSYTIEHPVSPDGFYKHPTRVVTIECDAKST